MGYWSLSPEAGSRHKMCPSVNCNKEWYTVCSVITVHITISLYCWIYKKSQLLVVFIPNWNHPSYKIKKNNNNNLLPLSVPLLLCSNTAVFFDYAHIFFIPTALHIITVAFQFRLCAGMSVNLLRERSSSLSAPKHTSDTDKEPASAVAPFSFYDVFTQSNNEQIQFMSDGRES